MEAGEMAGIGSTNMSKLIKAETGNFCVIAGNLDCARPSKKQAIIAPSIRLALDTPENDQDQPARDTIRRIFYPEIQEVQ